MKKYKFSFRDTMEIREIDNFETSIEKRFDVKIVDYYVVNHDSYEQTIVYEVEGKLKDIMKLYGNYSESDMPSRFGVEKKPTVVN